MVELLKLAEVARRLGISEPTARRYVKSGKLPSVYIGGSYRVRETDIEVFLRQAEVRPGENLPKAAAPSSEPRTEERRAAWDAAVRNARQLREHGRTRMQELLSSWRESKERGEPSDARQGLRAAMGELLQEALDARSALQENASVPALDNIPLDRIPIHEWEEIAEADRFYLALVDMVLGAAYLSIRRERKPGREVHEVEEAA